MSLWSEIFDASLLMNWDPDSNSSNSDFLLPILIFYFQFWFSTSNSDFLLPILIFYFQFWFSTSNSDFLLPILIFYFQFWFLLPILIFYSNLLYRSVHHGLSHKLLEIGLWWSLNSPQRLNPWTSKVDVPCLTLETCSRFTGRSDVQPPVMFHKRDVHNLLRLKRVPTF